MKIIIDETKAYAKQSDEAKQAIDEALQAKVVDTITTTGYPDFDAKGNIAFSCQITDDNGSTFQITEYREQNQKFSKSDRSVKNRIITIKKI